jgi:GDP-4-dehydro-6-deoxy-D-mannose reductase
MNVLIIGAAGFVGSYLIKHCKEVCGWNVSATKMAFESFSYEGVDVYDLNILELSSITELLDKLRPDYIFHLAAQSSVASSWKNPGLTIDVNIKGSVNVLDAVRAVEAADRAALESAAAGQTASGRAAAGQAASESTDVKKPWHPRILLIGSGEEYGHILPEETPIRETNLLRPGNIYAATKACQNMLGSIYAQAYQMDIMMVRAFNHIGPNQAPLFVVADFCKQVADIEAGLQEPVIRVGNLSAKRDFTDVRDVVKAYALLVEKGSAGETYNVGSGHALAIEEILHHILSLSSVSIQVEVDEQKLRPVDVPIIEADTGKLEAQTGWQRSISLDQTLQETLDYWRAKVTKIE